MIRKSHVYNRFPTQWFRILLIAGILVFSAGVPVAILRGYSILFLVSVTGLLALVGLLNQPALGFILIMVAGMFIPYSGPSGLNVALLGVVLLLMVWLLSILTKTRSSRWVSSRTMLPVIVFIVAAFLSFGIGQFPWYSFARQAPLDAQLGGLAIYVFSAAAFLLAANLIRELRWLEWITWIFIALGAFYVIVGRLVFGEFLQIGLIVDFFQRGSIGSVFWTWLAALSLGQAIYNRRLHPFWRVALGSLVLTALSVEFFLDNGWKSGWLPPLIVILVVIAIPYWRKAVWLLPLAIIPAIDLARDIIATDQYSFGTRLDAWGIIIQIVRANPILGLGFANYYWYTPLFPIRGWSVAFNSHSQYMDIIAQMGLVGLFLFLWLVWEVGKSAWRLRERAPGGFARGYVYAVLGGLVGTLVAGFLVDWVLPFVYNVGLSGFRGAVLAWVFLGGLVCIEQIVREQAVTHGEG